MKTERITFGVPENEQALRENKFVGLTICFTFSLQKLCLNF